MLHLVDSSGWIETFMDSTQAEFFKAALAKTDSLIVPSISLYEVHKRLSRSLPASLVNQCLDVMQLARVVDLTPSRAIAASGIAQSHKLALADAVMYSIALEFKATFWTQDVDYLGLLNVEYKAKSPLPPHEF